MPGAGVIPSSWTEISLSAPRPGRFSSWPGNVAPYLIVLSICDPVLFCNPAREYAQIIAKKRTLPTDPGFVSLFVNQAGVDLAGCPVSDVGSERAGRFALPVSILLLF
ncbi:MAG: hypothetical protein CSA52_02985 [Gammaproteobacteria bacterium]|nr:MAG: hypothetical protein CSB48_03720 [Pseudomonadota bacterium]PIE38162.1 MAG: hypothetical protein CSA52_02985 [Gammaproteobacteria bacterium]